MNKIDAIMKDINEWRDIPIKGVSQETRIKSILEKHIQEPTEERDVEIDRNDSIINMKYKTTC